MNKQKVKIIFSNYDDTKNPYYHGGGARSIFELTKLLVKNYDITVITSKYPGSKDETLNKVKFKRIGLSLAGPKLGQLIFQLILPVYILKSEFDIWFESFTPPYSTAFLPLFTTKPVIGLVNLLSGEDKTKQYKLPFKTIESFGIRKYKYFISLTSNLKKRILKINPNSRITVIPHGVEIPKVVSTSESKYILFLGRLEIFHKGLDLLLKSFQQASNKIADDLYIAGSGISSDEAKLNSLIKDFGLTKRIKLLGDVEGKKKAKIYSNSKFIVMPSRYEGQGIVALEAMSYKKPVLCFDIADLNWFDKEGSVKVKAFDVNEYAKKMVVLSRNKFIRRKIGSSGRKFASDFNWLNNAKTYDKYIKDILKITL